MGVQRSVMDMTRGRYCAQHDQGGLRGDPICLGQNSTSESAVVALRNALRSRTEAATAPSEALLLESTEAAIQSQ